MTAYRLGFCAALGLLLSISFTLPGCAGGQSECHPITWTGTCSLLRVDKVREAEFPLPTVTLEAIYRPQPGANGGPVVGDMRREFTVLDQYEDALRAQLDAHKNPNCYINPPAPGVCQPGPMVVDVPEFDSSKAQAAPVDSGPKGCAQIEATSAQDKVTQAGVSSASIVQRFEFGADSSDLGADNAGPLDAIAAQLKQAKNLQCVGVVGAWVRGESVALAFARARAVRDALVQRGVEPERLIPLTVDPPMGNGGTEPPDPRARRVTLSVLLDLPPKH